MTTAEIVTLSVVAIRLAMELSALARKEIEKDETLSPEKRQEYIERINLAQVGVSKIE